MYFFLEREITNQKRFYCLSRKLKKFSFFQFLALSFSFEAFFVNISGLDNKVVPGPPIGKI